jgi:hypothetical protein
MLGAGAAQRGRASAARRRAADGQLLSQSAAPATRTRLPRGSSDEAVAWTQRCAFALQHGRRGARVDARGGTTDAPFPRRLCLPAAAARLRAAPGTRRTVRAAMQAAEQRLALTALPPALWHALFSLLPVDQRLRCREVCRGWRAALEDVNLWTRLDLSEASGVAAAHLENAAGLQAAAALRAGGQLQSLDVSGCVRLNFAALHRAAVGSTATLREIRVPEGFKARHLTALLRAAPQLRLLHAAELQCGSEQSVQLLQNEQLFAPLRLRRLMVDSRDGRNEDDDYDADDAALLALTLRLVAAAAPTELVMYNIDLSAAAQSTRLWTLRSRIRCLFSV